MGDGWRGGQRPDGDGFAILGREFELHPEGTGILKGGRFCDRICVLQHLCSKLCAGGVETRGRKGQVSSGVIWPGSPGVPDFLYC